MALPSSLASGGVVLIALCAYWASGLDGGATGGGGGDVLASACSGGVGAPPGHPLTVYLGRGAALLSGKSTAAITAATSAIPIALAAGLLSEAVAMMTARTSAGVLAGGLLALSDAAWSQATTPSTFGMGCMLSALLILLAAKVRGAGEGGVGVLLLAFGAVAGLAISHQHSAALSLVALSIHLATLPSVHKSLTPQLAGFVLLALISGAVFLPTAMVMLSGAMSGGASAQWGGLGVATPWGGAWHVLGGELGPFAMPLSASPFEATKKDEAGTLIHGMQHYLTCLPRDLFVLGLVPLLVGAVNALLQVRENPLGACLLGCLCLHVLLVAGIVRTYHSSALSLKQTERYHIQPNVFLFALVGSGSASLTEAFLGKHKDSAAAQIVESLTALALLCVKLGVHTAAHASVGGLFDQWAAGMLESVPEGSVLLVSADNPAHALSYAQDCLGLRPDVTVVNMPLTRFPWYVESLKKRSGGEVEFPGRAWDPYWRGPEKKGGKKGGGKKGLFSLQAFLRANVGKRQVFVDPASLLSDLIDGSWSATFVRVPVGAMMHTFVVNSDTVADLTPKGLKELSKAFQQSLSQFSAGEGAVGLPRQGSWEAELLKVLRNNAAFASQACWLSAERRSWDSKLLLGGIQFLQQNLEYAEQAGEHTMAASLAKNIAIFFDRLKVGKPQYARDAARWYRQYLGTRSADKDTERPKILQFVAGFERGRYKDLKRQRHPNPPSAGLAQSPREVGEKGGTKARSEPKNSASTGRAAAGGGGGGGGKKSATEARAATVGGGGGEPKKSAAEARAAGSVGGEGKESAPQARASGARGAAPVEKGTQGVPSEGVEKKAPKDGASGGAAGRKEEPPVTTIVMGEEGGKKKGKKKKGKKKKIKGGQL